MLANNLGWVTRQLRHPRWGFLDENDIREVLSRIWTHRAELHPPPLEPWSLSKVLNNVRLLQRFSFGAAFCSSRSSDAMLVRFFSDFIKKYKSLCNASIIKKQTGFPREKCGGCSVLSLLLLLRAWVCLWGGNTPFLLSLSLSHSSLLFTVPQLPPPSPTVRLSSSVLTQ